jgi:hypothetical protein
MTSEHVKRLARMCDVKIYKNGEKANVAGGAILIRGGLQVQSDNQQLPAAYPTTLSGIGFLPPQIDVPEIMAAAESQDYTVVLHFPEGLRKRVIAAGGTVDAGMLPSAHREKYLKRGSLYDEDGKYTAGGDNKEADETKRAYVTGVREGTAELGPGTEIDSI